MIASIAAANNPLSLLARSLKASRFIFNHHFHWWAIFCFFFSFNAFFSKHSLSKSRRAKRGHVNFVLHQFRETFVFPLVSLCLLLSFGTGTSPLRQGCPSHCCCRNSLSQGCHLIGLFWFRLTHDDHMVPGGQIPPNLGFRTHPVKNQGGESN